MIFVFNYVAAKYTVSVGGAVTVPVHVVIYWKNTESDCVRATLKQNISMSDRYLSASNNFLKQRYVTYLSLSLMSAVHSWLNMCSLENAQK